MSTGFGEPITPDPSQKQSRTPSAGCRRMKKKKKKMTKTKKTKKKETERKKKGEEGSRSTGVRIDLGVYGKEKVMKGEILSRL